MYVSVIGRFEAGTTKVIFKLSEKIWPSSVANLDPVNFAGSGIKLQLINFTYCDNPAHVNTHFPAPISLPFPAISNDYQDTIQIRIPKPFKLSHRRSTIYFVPHLDLTTNTSDYEDRADAGQYLPQQPRLRRAPAITDYDVTYHAGFDKPFVMTSFTKPGSTSAVEFIAKLKAYQEIRVNSTFGFLNLSNLNFAYERALGAPENVSAAAPDTHAKIEKLKIRVTVPPGLQIGFSDSRLWQALGFDLTEFQIQAFKIPDKPVQFFGPSNIASSLPITITANHWITAKATLNVQLRLLSIQRGKPSLGEAFKDTVSLGALRTPALTNGSITLPQNTCASDTSYALSVYETVLKNVAQELMINPNSLTAEENKAENTITLKQFIDPTSPTFTSQNFKVLIQAGPAASQMLGITSKNPCLWFPSDGSWKSDPISTTDASCPVDPPNESTYEQSSTTISPTPTSPVPGTPPLTSTPIPSPEPEKKRKAETSHPAAPPKKIGREDESDTLDQTDTESATNSATSITQDLTSETSEDLSRKQSLSQLENEKEKAIKQLEETKKRQEENMRLLEESDRLKKIREREQTEQAQQHLEQKKQREAELRELDEIKKQKEAALEEISKLKELHNQQLLETITKKEQELHRLDETKKEKEAALLLLEENAKRADIERQKQRQLEDTHHREKLAQIEDARRQTETHLQTLLEDIKQAQLKQIRLLEESQTIQEQNKAHLDIAQLTHLKELQKKTDDELLVLEEKRRQLEQEKNQLLQEAKAALALEKQKILEAAKLQAQLEKQKILDQAKQQAELEEKERKHAADTARRQLEQQTLFRQQEAIRLEELQTQLRVQSEALAEEKERLKTASNKLATVEHEKQIVENEMRLLKEQLKHAQDQGSKDRLQTDAAKLDSQQQQLQQQEDNLKNKITETTKSLSAVENTKRFLEEQTTRLQQDLHSTTTPTPDSFMDVDQPEEDAPSQTFQTPNASFSDTEPEPETTSDQQPTMPWDYIDIPNPSLAPASTFEPTQNQPLSRCPLPLNFPRTFTLILLEGLNRDYCMERGYCSVLGTVLTADNGTVQIIDNLCILQTNEIEQLTLDIVDDHLTSYSPAQTAYVKLDLKLHRLTKFIY